MTFPNLLYVAHRVPYPPDKGDRIRSFHLLRFLAKRSHVHLACLADEPVASESLAALRSLTSRLAIVPTGRWLRWLRAAGSIALGNCATVGLFSSPTLAGVVQSWAQEVPFATALASSSGMAQYLRLPGLVHVPAVVDLIDVDSQKWVDYAAESRGFKRWLYRLEGTRLCRYERELGGWARGLTLVSEQEAELYRERCGNGPIHAVENGVDLEYFQPAPPTAGNTCVFVGALDYRPNVDGAIWFCQEVWPKLRQANANARLSIVGRKPTPAVCQLGSIPGVTVVGQVPDVRRYVAEASVVVVPLRIARGIQNKVLEALAMGKATVASGLALEGLKAVPGQEIEVATTSEEWVQAISSLWANEARRTALGIAGRHFVEEYHAWHACLSPMKAILSLPDGDGNADSIRPTLSALHTSAEISI